MSFRVGKTIKILLKRREAELSSVNKNQHVQVAYIVRNELNRAREVNIFGGGGRLDERR